MDQQYIAPMKIGSRIFAPRPFTTLITIAVIFILLTLGRWQLHRAAEKQVLFDAFASGTDVTRPIDAATSRLARYQHVEAVGRYDAARQILLDNMFDAEGRAGYFVITPFALVGGGWVLVNRGWIPLGASRAERPDVPVAQDQRRLRGRADDLPRPGIRLDAPALGPPYPVVANFPTLSDIGRLLHVSAWTPATELVLLDPGEADGYARNWRAPGFAPMRHIAYAVQWFALAVAVAVTYAVTNLKRSVAGGSAG
jgi:surfeit locus 1 family protein